MSVGTVLANAAAAAQCLVDLAEHGEEMVPLLRGEFERVVVTGGGGDGIITFERKVPKPFTLPDGTRLKAGEHIAAPAFHVGWDPEYIEPPEVFDGLRFHWLRSQGGLSATTTTEGSKNGDEGEDTVWIRRRKSGDDGTM
ncbi:hypothetical protein BO83DRAFT_389204 [Aspergillus eucalypticola CBS 122712]|uniref:Uncharacterized protein n=1 Tax=Aspergillus eucalypticola (strain CBS 122712 / IBT 29274) TaxID=1448314 RepID=A0A317VBV4_ASPEC|nr:uncharacterized protein BO83DRAFT_389204 [Aspergillus eucalypticola CBS 122712]PWY71843.1 hypothetical protein BO83DRAFT_389204 [Aspergillus eucalypticola CBS 122712]